MIYSVITDNGGGNDQIYHDVEGQVYTFPTIYRSRLQPGTQVIYHRKKRTSSDPDIPTRMSDESHYFGVAEIGEVVLTSDGNLRATILNYKRFDYPVDIHKPDGSYYEEDPFWQRGVRPADKTVYDAIMAAGKSPLFAPGMVSVKSHGVKTTTSLAEGISSAPFFNKKYQVVTGPKGYYLKNLADGVYYEIAKVYSFSYKEGTIKVLAKKSGSSSGVMSYLVRHESTAIVDLGIIDQIENGLHFSGKIDGVDVDVYLNI